MKIIFLCITAFIFSISAMAEERDSSDTEATYCINCTSTDFDLSGLISKRIPDLGTLQTVVEDDTHRLSSEDNLLSEERVEVCQRVAGSEIINFSAGVCRGASLKFKRTDILQPQNGRKTLGVRGKVRF